MEDDLRQRSAGAKSMRSGGVVNISTPSPNHSADLLNPLNPMSPLSPIWHIPSEPYPEPKCEPQSYSPSTETGSSWGDNGSSSSSDSGSSSCGDSGGSSGSGE